MTKPARIGRIRLKPNFVRAKHLGPVTRPQKVAFLSTTAQLLWEVKQRG